MIESVKSLEQSISALGSIPLTGGQRYLPEDGETGRADLLPRIGDLNCEQTKPAAQVPNSLVSTDVCVCEREIVSVCVGKLLVSHTVMS